MHRALACPKRSDRGERRKRSDSGERRKRSDSGERRKRSDRGERRKRSDSGERRELGKASEKNKKKKAGPFPASFSLHCSPRRCPILRAFPNYLNAWNRLTVPRYRH